MKTDEKAFYYFNMLEVSKVKKKVLFAVVGSLCLFAATLFLSGIDSNADSEPSLPFLLVANEELLDLIFEEEKSNRICRFMKNRKMKA